MSTQFGIEGSSVFVESFARSWDKVEAVLNAACRPAESIRIFETERPAVTFEVWWTSTDDGQTAVLVLGELVGEHKRYGGQNNGLCEGVGAAAAFVAQVYRELPEGRNLINAVLTSHRDQVNQALKEGRIDEETTKSAIDKFQQLNVRLMRASVLVEAYRALDPSQREILEDAVRNGMLRDRMVWRVLRQEFSTVDAALDSAWRPIVLGTDAGEYFGVAGFENEGKEVVEAVGTWLRVREGARDDAAVTEAARSITRLAILSGITGVEKLLE